MKMKKGKSIKKTNKTNARRTKKSVKRAARSDKFDKKFIEGEIDCKGNRFGFVSLENGGSDVFIHGADLNGARHGDIVRVCIVRERKGSGEIRREGYVSEILERSNKSGVATIVFRDNEFFAVPDDRHYGELIEVDGLGGAAEHDKVIIDTDGARARVLAVLGRFDEIGMDVKSVIAAHNLRTEFPADVIEQADSFGNEIDPREANAPYRVDFRDKTLFTIDGSDSKDFDDAVSLERTEHGYRLGVYIADVAEYVKERTPLDTEAYERGTSVYLADRVIPMLPEQLSNGLCSLNEGCDRLALCAVIDLDEHGNRKGLKLCEGVIRSSARLTYAGVQALLDGDARLRERYASLVPMLELMGELAKKRIKLRRERGTIDFKLTETQIKFDADGRVADIEKRPSLFSMNIIEEFMILANCAVAEFAKTKGLPYVYRVHERPSPEKLTVLNDYLDAVGVRACLPLSPSPKQVQKLLSTIEPAISPAVNKIALRAMAKATYEPSCDGHFGLAEEFYCHFTSPIRRYPDLAGHRILKAFLRGGAAAVKKYKSFVTAASVRSSKTERVAQECERKVDDYKKAEYMSHRVGEKFDGVISSVTEFGFFVELENSAEGLVRIATLPPSAFFDQKRLRIVCGAKKFALGDPVKIIVDKVSGDRVDFLLA